MQTYVEKLLQEQMQQAEQLSEKQGMELRQYDLFRKLSGTEDGKSDEKQMRTGSGLQEEKTGEDAFEKRESLHGAAALLRAFDEIQTTNARAQSANRLTQAFMLQSIQNSASEWKQADWRTGPVQEETTAGRYSQMLLSGGVAARPTERSMREISRFFERDSRRYGN